MTIIVMETVNLSLSDSYIRQRLSDVGRKRIRRVYLQKFISDKRQGEVLHNPVYIKRPICQMPVLSLQNPNRTLPVGKIFPPHSLPSPQYADKAAIPSLHSTLFAFMPQKAEKSQPKLKLTNGNKTKELPGRILSLTSQLLVKLEIYF